jgi:hypothetical protein
VRQPRRSPRSSRTGKAGRSAGAGGRAAWGEGGEPPGGALVWAQAKLLLGLLAANILAVTGTLSIALLLLATWLYLPFGGAGVEPAPGVRVVIVDASASARRLRPAWPTWAREQIKLEAEAAQAHGEDIAVVVFADEVRRVYGPGPAAGLHERLSGRAGAPLVPSDGAGEDDGSRLGAALQAAAGIVLSPERAPGRVVLLGSQPATDGDPNPLLGTIARGALLELRPLATARKSDLALLSMDLPLDVETGAPLSIDVRLLHTPGLDGSTRGVLDLEIVESGVQRLRRVPLELSRWSGERRLRVPLGAAVAGLTRVNGRVRLEEDRDRIPENDRATAVTSSGNTPVVGVLNGAQLTGFPPGLERVDLTPQELPLLLPSLDAIVAIDVSHLELTELVPEQLLVNFLRAGGGWLSTAGRGFLRGWSELSSTRGFQALLPLEPAPPEGGDRDVILLLDGSQSMEGQPFDAVRSAAVDLVEAAPSSDRVTLQFFTAALQTPVLLKERNAPEDGRAAGREAARSLLSRAVPRGFTHLISCLEMLVDQRPIDAPPALVLLLSDGREMEASVMPYAERAELLKARLRGRHMRIVPIAVGDRVELKYLELFAEEGQEVRHVRDLEDLRRLFLREIGATRLVEAKIGETLALSFQGQPGGLAAEVMGESTPPPVTRFVRARSRAQGAGASEVAWVDHNASPVLALARVGRGRIALLTTALNAEWSPAWTTSGPPAGAAAWAELAPLLRWLARRPPRASEERPHAWLEGDRLRVRGLSSSSLAVLPAWLERAEVKVPLELTVPMRSGGSDTGGFWEREGRLGASDRGALLGDAVSGSASLFLGLPGQDSADSGSGAHVAISLALGPAPEFLGLGTYAEVARFDRIGAAEPVPAGLSSGPETRSLSPGGGSQGSALPGPRPQAKWVLALAVVCLSIWAFLALRVGWRKSTESAGSGGQGGRSFGR